MAPNHRLDRAVPAMTGTLLDPAPGPESTALARRMLYFTAVVLVSALVGVALLFVHPLLIVGAITAVLAGLALLRWPYVGLLCYVAIFMLRIGEVYPALAPLRLERIMGAMTLASFFLQQYQTQGRIFLDRTRTTRFLFFTLLAALISVPFAYWRGAAVTGLINLSKIIIFYLLIVQIIDNWKNLRTFVLLYLGFVVHIGASSVIAYMQGGLQHRMGIDRALGTTSAGDDPNHLGATMACTFPMMLLLAMHRPLRWWRLVFAGSAVLMVVTLVLTGSRSGLVGFLAGLGHLWWTSKHRIVYGLLGIAVMCGAWVLVPAQYQERYATMTEGGDLNDTSSGRVEIWERGLQLFIQRPITGVGINSFVTANAALGEDSPHANKDAHSLYVQVPAEMGIVGAFAFFGFLFGNMALFRRLSKEMQRSGEQWDLERVVLAGLYAGYVVLLWTGIFGHSLLRDTWYVYAAIGVVMWRLYVDRVPLDPHAGSPGRPLLSNRSEG